MSLLSSFRRALTPKPAPPLPPAMPMHIGGLQLECPVCSFDLFRHRQLVTSNGQYGTLNVLVAAIACDRCGALQLFDASARSMPDLTIPPRRMGRLRRSRPTEPPLWPGALPPLPPLGHDPGEGGPRP